MDETVEGRAEATAAAQGDTFENAVGDVLDHISLKTFEDVGGDTPPVPLREAPRIGQIAPENPSGSGEEDLNRRSLSIAMARRNTGLSDSTIDLESEAQLMKDSILGGKEGGLRLEIAQRALENMGDTREAFIESAIQTNSLTPKQISILAADPDFFKTPTPHEAIDQGVVEKEVAGHLVSSSIASEPQAVRSRVEMDFSDLMEENYARTLQLRTLSKKYEDRLKDQAFVTTIAEALVGVVPFSESQRLKNQVGGGKSFLPSTNLEEQRHFLYNVSKEEFNKSLLSLEQKLDNNALLPSNSNNSNELIALQFLKLMAGNDDGESALVDAGFALDAASLLPIGMALKGTRNIVAAMRTTGGRGRAAQTLAEEVQTAKQGELTTPSSVAGGVQEESQRLADAVEEILPGLASTERSAPQSLGVTGETLRILQDNERVLKDVFSSPNAERLTPEELDSAVDATIEGLRVRYDNVSGDDVVDFFVTKENPSNNVRTVEAFLGTGHGRARGFVSPEAATAHILNNYGVSTPRTLAGRGANDIPTDIALTPALADAVAEETQAAALIASKLRTTKKLPEAFSVVEKDGMFFIKVEKNVDERGYIKAYEDPQTAKEVLDRVPGVVSRTVMSPNTYINKVLEGDRKLSVNQQQKLSTSFGIITKPIEKLNSAQRNDLTEVLLRGQQTEDGKVFNMSELKQEYRDGIGREPLDKEVNAYYAFQDANRAVWMARNSKVHGDLARKGFEKYSVTSRSDLPLEGNGLVVKQPNKVLASNYVYDVEKNTVVRPGDRAGVELPDNKIIIEAQYQLDAFDKFPIKHILVDKGGVDLSPIDWVQVNYRPGGSVDYGGVGKHFLKQTRTGSFEDGAKYLMEPRTHHIFETTNEGNKWAENYNTAVDAYKEFKAGRLTATQIEEVITSRTAYTLEDFERLVDKKQISLDHKFELVADRDVPLEHRALASDTSMYQVPFDGEQALNNFYRTNKLAFTKQRGDRLINPDGTKAQILSPLMTLKKGIEQAVGMKSFYNITADKVERWHRTFRPFLAQPSDNALYDMIHGVLNTKDPKIRDAAEALRRPMMQLLNTNTRQVDIWEQTASRLADSVAGTKIPLSSSLETPLRKAAQLKPVETLRRLAFHSAFLGDISQFAVQSMTAAAAITLDPINGIRAARAAFPIRLALNRRFDPAFVEHMASDPKWAALHGMNPKEFKDMFETLKRGGTTEVGGSLTVLDQQGSAIVLNGVMRKGKSVAEALEYPFFAAERNNRTIGSIIAYNRLKNADPNFDFTSTRGAGEFAKVADDFSINMTRASNAPWQQGILTIPTQFSSYFARYLEATLPQWAGGSNAFSSTQKATLALGQIAFFGMAGGAMVGRNFMGKMLDSVGVKDETQREVAMEGLVDTMINSMFDGEISTAGRLAVLGGPNLIAKAFDPEVSAVELAGGPAVDLMHRGFGGIKEAIMMLSVVKGEDPQAMGRTAFTSMKNTLRSTSRLMRAHTALVSGEYYSSRSGQLLLSGITKGEAIGIAFGMQPRELAKLYERMDVVANKKQLVEEYASMVAKNIEQTVVAASDKRGENSLEKVRNIGNIMTMIQATQPDLYADIFKRVTNKMGTDKSQRMWRQYLIEKGFNTELSKPKGN